MFEKDQGFFKKLKNGLSRTRESLMVAFTGVSVVDDDFFDELEESLIMSDIGVYTAEEVIEKLKAAVEEKHIATSDRCKKELCAILKSVMADGNDDYRFFNEKSIVFVLGVNGVGKTTTIGKMAHYLKNRGKKVMMAACDTFRAAAIDQLDEWSKRSGVPMISQSEGSDPSAVLYDAMSALKARDTDILLCDTAGRLHNKKNLMEELKKMNRIIDRDCPGILRENLLVLDATTGQNAMNQAKEFMEVSDITGIVLTKMDGTAKGGIVIAIEKELGIPVKFIGVGEKIDDLQPFNKEEFIEALFEEN